MKLASAVMAVLLAVLWTVIGMHCQIELLTGMECLECVTQSNSASSSPCEDCNGCIPIEKGHYQSIEKDSFKPMPLAALLPILTIFTEVDAEPLGSHRLISDAMAPSSPWQFSSRAALPPRAPSYIS